MSKWIHEFGTRTGSQQECQFKLTVLCPKKVLFNNLNRISVKASFHFEISRILEKNSYIRFHLHLVSTAMFCNDHWVRLQFSCISMIASTESLQSYRKHFLEVIAIASRVNQLNQIAVRGSLVQILSGLKNSGENGPKDCSPQCARRSNGKHAVKMFFFFLER